MARANTRHAAGQDLAALLDELRQDVGALVVDEIHLLDTELADFLLAKILALSARTSAGTTRSTGTAFTTTTAGSAFTAWTTRMAAFTARAALALTLTTASAFAFPARSTFALRGSGSGGGSLRLFLFL